MSNIVISEPKVISLEVSTSNIRSVAWHPIEDLVALGGNDENPFIYVCNPEGKHIKTLTGHKSSIHQLLFSSCGRILFSASSDKDIGLWDTYDLEIPPQWLNKKDSAVKAIAINNEGTWLVSGSANGSVIFWRRTEIAITVNNMLTGSGDICHLQFSSDNKIFSICSGSKHVKFVSIDSKKTEKTIEFESAVNCLAFHPDEGVIITGDKSGKIRITNIDDATSPQLVLNGHEDEVNNLVINHLGTIIVSVSDDKTVRFWDIKTGKLLKTMGGFRGGLESIALSPVGDKVLLDINNCSEKDGESDKLKYAGCILDFGRPIGKVDPRLPGKHDPDDESE